MSDKFTPADLVAAIEDLSMCAYFPSDEGVRAAIMRLLARMVPDRQALLWLVQAYTDRIGKWHGPAELRAVLCTRFRPADGVEAFSSLPGFRPEDSEEQYLEQHEQQKIGWTGDAPLQISAAQPLQQLIEGLAKKRGIQ